MYKRLLVPLDGSSLAEAVLPIIERLAPAWNSTVLLLHILERRAPEEVHGERHLTEPREAATYLERIAQRLRERAIPVDYHVHDVLEGNVARAVADHADEVSADLVIICTHGRGRVPNMLFGSIAQQVLHRGATPVLLARAPLDHVEPTFDPSTVLVPLDATTASEAALEPAVRIASSLGAALHLVMVVATRETIRGDRLPTATWLPSATRAELELEEQEAGAYLRRLSASLQSNVPVTVEVRRGDIASALLDQAEELRVGLIVLATHGRAGLQAVWAGSVAARLLGRTRQPVLLLRAIEQ
jgi:nucleotide-binding universal stress UspA family protein